MVKEKRNNFFSVLWDSQTYLNLFYLLVSFPLGIIYFCVLVTGISLGFGLIITWFGIPILLGMMFLWRGFANFERKTTELILGVKILHKIKKEKKKQKEKFWNRLKDKFKDGYTWTSLGYLFIKFPLGIFSFVVVVTLLSVALALIVTPLFYWFDQVGILAMDFCINNSFCFIKSYAGAAVYSVIGIFLLFVFLHVTNGLAKLSGWLAKALLEKR